MISDDERDRILMQRVKRGEADALSALLRAYWIPLNQYARGIVGSPDAAQDIVQDVFFRLWRHRESVVIRTAVAPYLYAMTRNQAITLLNTDHKDRVRDGRWSVEHRQEQPLVMNDGERTVEVEDVRSMLVTALSDVAPRSREIFLLSWEHNMSYADIAAMFDISIATVRNQMSRAVTHLARVLRARYWGDQGPKSPNSDTSSSPDSPTM